MNTCKNQGFTLIEILITIVLIVGGLLMLMQAMNVGIFADASLEHRFTALHLASEKLEELKEDGYSHANLTSGAHIEGSINGFDFVDQRQWTVNFVDANLNSTTTDTGLKDVDVELKWTLKGAQETVNISTLIADY